MPVVTSSYNGIIPQSPDIISFSQGQLLNNFGAIESLVSMDLINFPNGTSGGQHYRVTLANSPVANTPPVPQATASGDVTWNAASLATVVGLYSATNTAVPQNTSNQKELFINKTNFAGVVQIPSTASVLGLSSPAPGVSGNATGWTMLPSGIKLVWGNFAGNGSSAQTITLGGSQRFATTILSVQLTIISSNTTFAQDLARVVNFPSGNSFRAVVSTPGGGAFSTSTVMFLAIGY